MGAQPRQGGRARRRRQPAAHGRHRPRHHRHPSRRARAPRRHRGAAQHERGGGGDRPRLPLHLGQPGFSRITGYSEEEVIGQNSRLLDSSQHSAEFYRRVRDVLERTGHWAGEMWQRRKDGEEFLGWIEMSEVRDAMGQRSHFVAVVNDITDKKRAEQELRYLANYDTLTGLPNRAL